MVQVFLFWPDLSSHGLPLTALQANDSKQAAASCHNQQ
jgi:hypothetical protein